MRDTKLCTILHWLFINNGRSIYKISNLRSPLIGKYIEQFISFNTHEIKKPIEYIELKIYQEDDNNISVIMGSTDLDSGLIDQYLNDPNIDNVIELCRDKIIKRTTIIENLDKLIY